MAVRSVILFTFMSLCICLLLFADFGKSSSLFLDKILDLGHVPLFAVVAGMTLWALDRENWLHADKRTHVHAFALSAAMALATEIIQHFTPERSFQIGDIVKDVIGSAVFLQIAYQYKRELPGWKRLAMSSTAAVLLLAASVPALVAYADELRARHDFPLLGSFETCGEMERWQIEEGLFKRVRMHATQGEFSLEANLPPGLYPGITMDYPPRDWRGYNTLTFNAFLEDTGPLTLTVRINDLEHNEEIDDRYNRTFVLQPGRNHVIVNLSEVEHAPKGRLMDMEHISMICIFSYKLKKPRTVYFDNFRLEKNG